MNKKSFLLPILFGLITIFLVASCDKDFNELGTGIVGDEHFGFDKYTDVTIKAYNQKLGPVASNNLAINSLGFYTNPAFGTTQANFVTQLELASVSPVFNNTDPANYDTNPTVLDSVVMEIPYFKTFVSKTGEVSTYKLDSIYGATPYDQTAATDNSKFKLSVYQSNYYLRDLDPNQALTEQQLFYTNDDNTIDGNKVPTLLNNAPLSGKNADGHENEHFYFDKREHRTTYLDDDGVTVLKNTPTVPSMRLHLDKTVFSNAILSAPTSKLADNATFKNYFRGIYFKAEGGNPGNMAMMNFKGGKITLYYNEDKKTTVNNVDSYERVNKNYVLNLTGNTVSLLNNSNENADYLTATSSAQEASKLYVKGGEGSMAIIDLFGTVDTKGYILNPNYNESIPISSTNQKYNLVNSPNGISDEIDDIKFKGWLINEANLTFYVDKTVGNPLLNVKAVEPNRIFLYDLTHKKVLLDYSYDNTTDAIYAKRNKYIFGGILLNQNGSVAKQIKNANNEITEKGFKYKIRITNYVRSLIKNDSTNVRLGLCVTENIASVGLSKLKTSINNVSIVPTMSVINPLGTILYGTNPAVPDDKRLKLEIYYTKPN